MSTNEPSTHAVSEPGAITIPLPAGSRLIGTIAILEQASNEVSLVVHPLIPIELPITYLPNLLRSLADLMEIRSIPVDEADSR